MISKMDDYPVHQISDVVRNTATSDRNFYDRYYFNLMCPDENVFIVFSLGQYPNLATQDCFLLLRRIWRDARCGALGIGHDAS